MTRATNARRLRQQSGHAEDHVWKVLRAGRLEGWKFRRQHPVGPYIADFACPELRLILELDGEVHDLPDVAHRDTERSTSLEALGWTVLRFSNDVAKTRTTELIDAIRQHAPRQRPNR